MRLFGAISVSCFHEKIRSPVAGFWLRRDCGCLRRLPPARQPPGAGSSPSRAGDGCFQLQLALHAHSAQNERCGRTCAGQGTGGEGLLLCGLAQLRGRVDCPDLHHPGPGILCLKLPPWQLFTVLVHSFRALSKPALVRFQHVTH